MTQPYIKKSKSDNWATPKDLYDKLDKEFKFKFDPCPYQYKVDVLSIDWDKSNFVNQPFSNIKEWSAKCREQQLKGNMSVLLIPARTDTKYFHNNILPYTEIRFIKGRLKYKSLDNLTAKPTSAPFPSMICIYKTK